MSNKCVIVLTSALLVMLAGCGGNDAGFGPAPDPGATGVEAVFATDSNGDPAELSNVEALGTSIDDIFGGENDEPVPVNPDDSIGDVLDRAKSS